MKGPIAAAAAAALLLSAPVAATECHADECLRAMRATQTPGRLQAARSFCSEFTKTQVDFLAMPTYALENCKRDQQGGPDFHISSACSCIAATSAAAPTATGFPTSNPAETLVPSSSKSSYLNTTTTASTAPTSTGACAVVSSAWAAQISATPTPTIAAKLALECLNSVPLYKEGAIKILDQMEPYLEWQSDSAYKKDPPADYFYPPHDIFTALAQVKENLLADRYQGEYAFQQDLYAKVFAPAHDGHFYWYGDALTKAIEYGRQFAIVSVSEDGDSLPVIKVYDDIVKSPATASTIKLINGIDAATYVGDFIYQASFNQDADAAYNTMFYEKAVEGVGTGQGYFKSGGRARYLYPGDSITVTFENGTVKDYDNVGRIKGNWAGVVDGKTFFQKFCSGATSSGSAAASAPIKAKVPGYPLPVVITNDTVVSGYYLEGAGFEDVAVIAMNAFESESPLEFQQVAQEFFARAKADGKTKLVVDVQQNGGGYILQGYDLFRQLFPDIVQDGDSRWRESDTFKALTHVISDASASFNPNTSTAQEINLAESAFNWRYDLDRNNQPFTSYEDKFAPRINKGDPFTDLMRWNFDDPLTTVNETFGIGFEMTGYGTRANFTRPFGGPENIIMLMDGYCASTCTLFAEFMRLNAGVKVIAMGGRPQPGPIQAVGGIKGSQVLAFSDIYGQAVQAIALTNNTEYKTTLSRINNYPITRSSNAAVNVRDHILPPNFQDGIPAQFVREDADCRIFWTPDMITDVTAVWKAAADAAFNGGNCNSGAINYPKRALTRPRRVFTKPKIGTKVVPRVVQRRDSLALKSDDFVAKQLQKAVP